MTPSSAPYEKTRFARVWSQVVGPFVVPGDELGIDVRRRRDLLDERAIEQLPSEPLGELLGEPRAAGPVLAGDRDDAEDATELVLGVSAWS